MTHRARNVFSVVILKLFRKIRMQLYRNYANSKLNLPKSTKINGRVNFTEFVTVGENCHFNGLEVTGAGKVVIGNNFHSGKDCVFITSFHNYEGDYIPYDNTFVDKNIIIEDNVWLGRNVIVLGGAHLGEGCIIQAGSVVVGEVPAMSIAGGHPAKVFKTRSEERYLKNKESQRFF